MINDKMLKNAAESSCKTYVSFLENGFNTTDRHVFSALFESKIEKLKRRAAHPVLYRPVTRAAAVILAILLAGSLWLTFDTSARTAFFGWIKEEVEGYFVYHYSEDVDNSVEPSNYEPSFIPKGYKRAVEIDSGSMKTILYSNDEGKSMQFNYIYDPSDVGFIIDAVGGTTKKATVKGYEAELVLFENVEKSNDILWTDENEHTFHISAFLNENDLLRVAESIYEIK